MACSYDLYNEFLINTDEGGTWQYIGYSVDNNTYGAGGNWPWNTAIDHVIVNFNDIKQGYYKLQYFKSGDCGDFIDVIIPVLGSGNAGTDNTINLCINSGTFVISDYLNSYFDEGILQANFEYTGSLVNTSGYIQNNINTPLDDTIDTNQLSAGTYDITLNIQIKNLQNYPKAVCSNCDNTTATLTINIIELTAQISVDDCIINLDSISGCQNLPYELQKWNGSNFIDTGITSLPYEADEDTNWRIKIESCDCIAYSNTVTTNSQCECVGGITVSLDNNCTLHVDSAPCSNDYHGAYWEKWSGNTWIKVTASVWGYTPLTDFDLQASNGDYRFYAKCADTNCKYYSEVITVSNCSNSSCNAVCHIINNGCLLSLECVDCGDNWTETEWLRWNGSAWVVVGTGDTYQVTQSNSHKARRRYCDNCNDWTYSNNNLSLSSECWSCNSEAQITQNGCILTANATNCTPTSYQWYKNNVAIPGATSQTYTVVEDATYHCCIGGCPDCGTICSSSIQVNGCGNACESNAWITENNCILTCNTTNCNNPTYQWYRNNIAISGATSQTYQSTDEATYYCEVSNCPNCDTLQTGSITTVGCPPCNSTLTAVVNQCTITASVTNCSNPTFEFWLGSVLLQSGSSNTYTHNGNDTITIKAINCPNCGTLSIQKTITNCNTSCNSILSLSVTNCTITASVTNCSNPTYTFKLGSTVLQSGSSNTYIHNANDEITVEVIGCPNCGTLTGNIQITNCINCICSTALSVNDDCLITAVDSNCTNYNSYWYWFNGNIWILKGQNTTTIQADENGQWKRVLSKNGCNDVIETISINCSEQCTLSLDVYQQKPNDCQKAEFEWSGAMSDNVEVIFMYAINTPNGNTCTGAYGWMNYIPDTQDVSIIKNTDGTGSGWVKSDCLKCLRIIITDNDVPNCQSINDEIYIDNCCCEDTPSLTTTVKDCHIELIARHPETDVINKAKIVPEDSNTTFNRSFNVNSKIECNCPHSVELLQEIIPFHEMGIAAMSLKDGGKIIYIYIDNPYTGVITSIKLWDSCSNGDCSNPLYTTCTGVGCGGNLTQSEIDALTFDNTNDNSAEHISAITKQFKNAIKTELGLIFDTHYHFSYIKRGYNQSQNDRTVFLLKLKIKHNDTDWVGINKIKYYDETPSVSLSSHILRCRRVWDFDEYGTSGFSGLDKFGAYFCRVKASNCGHPDLINKKVIDYKTWTQAPYINTNGWTFQSSPEDDQNILDDNHVPCNNDSYNNFEDYQLYTISVLNVCNGATYLWEDGTSGTTHTVCENYGQVTCEITCPNGCIYNLSITI